jgi:hypothetical protein
MIRIRETRRNHSRRAAEGSKITLRASFPVPIGKSLQIGEIFDRACSYVRVDQRVVAALPELGEAIRSFQPVPGPGESVAEWLAERALSRPQEATVRVRLSHGRVAGVYALCAAQVALSCEERAQLGGVHYRTQPAILLAQFARAAGSPGVGDELLSHAVDTTSLALAYIGATVLVVDPFDERTADIWQERFGFQDSEQRAQNKRRACAERSSSSYVTIRRSG